MYRLYLEGEYLEIIVELLGEKYRIDSLIKLVFMSFCIRNCNEVSFRSRKKDYVDTFFSSLDVKFLAHPEEVASIFEVIEKLKSSGWIQIQDDNVILKKNIDDFSCKNQFMEKCRTKSTNPICEINKLDSRAFAEEVLRHV